MCQLLSGWISIDGLTVYPGDLVHHERGAEIHGISERVASPWEWTATGLRVIVSPAAKDKGATQAWYEELLRQKFGTRDRAIQWCLDHLSPSVRTLDLKGCAGLTSLPELPSVEWLDLEGCVGLTSLPELPSVRTLYLEGCKASCVRAGRKKYERAVKA